MDDVSYYDSQVQYQKKIGEIQKQRLGLEREMFSMMRSDKKLQNLKASKLRSYWQQVCERESKARERNEELLRDFENMEMKLSDLQAKTKKLRHMKVQYDEKVKQMYPKWRQEVEISKAKKHLMNRGIKLSPRKERNAIVPTPALSDVPGNERPRKKKASTRREKVKETEQSAVSFSSGKNEAVTESLQQDETKVSKQASFMMEQPGLTSTPVSEQNKSDLESQASMHPPPESFADDSPQRVVYVNTTAPTKTVVTAGHNVVHTIPTALSSNEGQSDFSSSSIVSEEPNETAKGDRRMEKVDSGSPSYKSDVSRSKTGPVASGSNATITREQVSSPSRSQHGMQQSPQKQHISHGGRKLESPPIKSAVKSPSRNSPRRQPSHDLSPLSTLSSHGERTRSPDVKAKSPISISSFGSDEMSPRPAAPLTENASYQALLKQHSGMQAVVLDSSDHGEESDEDDLENLLSPHEHPQNTRIQETAVKNIESESGNRDSFSDADSFKGTNSSRVYVPTAMSTGSTPQHRQQPTTKYKPPKAPWDSDTEDEDSIGNSSFLATTGGSSWKVQKSHQDTQDDFDFYD